MIRTFAADDAAGIIHDPATGFHHRPPWRPGAGRQVLDDTNLHQWPTVGSADISRSTPVSLCWSPLVRCNLSCPHCLDDTTVTERGAADRATIAATLAASGVLGIDISGGEPLLLRDLPDLARRITAGGTTAVSVTTNGWHLARQVDRLTGAIDAVRVSMDGPTATAHDAHRGPDSFRRACYGIRAAVAAGLPVQLQFVLMSANQHHLPAMIDLAADLEAGGLTVLQMLPIGTGAVLANTQMLTDDTAQQRVDALTTPPGFRLRLRRRAADAGSFTVIRADGRVWRNDPHGQGITRLGPLTTAAELTCDGAR